VCLVERNAEIDPEARTAVCRLWEALGAHTVDVDAAVHDAVLARTSHAPHVIASSLAILANRMGAKSAYVGNGFRDATRIAGSRPEIWRDICMENRQALSETLAQFRNCIEEFEQMLTDGDAARLENFFIEGNVARERVLGT
jgi:prephenate dehydrogenase